MQLPFLLQILLKRLSFQKNTKWVNKIQENRCKISGNYI